MFYYEKIPGCNEYIGHLSITKYTHNTLKKLKPLILKEIKNKGFPKVWACLPKHKQRMAEHFGFKFIRYELKKDGVYSYLLWESKNYVN